MGLDKAIGANGGAEKDASNTIKNSLVKVEGNNGSDVRQEHTNTVDRQSVQDGYKTGHGVPLQNVGC